jgi:glucosamine kinase
MLLIAESGSTKTSWIVLSEPKVQFETKGINPYYQSANEITELLKPHFNHHIFTAIHQVYFYGTGITDSSKEAMVQLGVKNALGYEVVIEANSDVIAAARSLFGDKAGIAGILGTGSNSCFWDGKKIAFQVPPLGFWLGDEGSGGFLGKSLVLSYLHKSMPENLRTVFIKKYGELSRLDILEKAYKQSGPNTYFAEYAAFYSENIEHAFIQNLLDRNFELFFELYISKYPMLAESQIGFVGSVAFYFKENIEKIALKFGINEVKIIRKPIDGLVKYHQE